ncbi:S-Ena type endospore appendage [Paenibacillus sp. NRS-1782]
METDTLTIGASLAFTKSGFTSITLTGTGVAPFTPPYQGEFCLTPRYPLG